MKVHLVRKETIEGFSLLHPQSRSSFTLWLRTLKEANWMRPDDIKESFSSADLLGRGTNRAVFDIGGNKYRLICHYVFGARQVHLFICWIGTHAEYTKICKNNEQYTINSH